MATPERKTWVLKWIKEYEQAAENYMKEGRAAYSLTEEQNCFRQADFYRSLIEDLKAELEDGIQRVNVE